MRPLVLFPYFTAHLIWSAAQLLLMGLGFWLVNGKRLDGWLVFAGSVTVHQALLLLIAHWYERREPVVLEDQPHEVPGTVSSLLAPWRPLRL